MTQKVLNQKAKRKLYQDHETRIIDEPLFIPDEALRIQNMDLNNDHDPAIK